MLAPPHCDEVAVWNEGVHHARSQHGSIVAARTGAQQAGRIFKIWHIEPGSPSSSSHLLATLQQGLRKLRYVAVRILSSSGAMRKVGLNVSLS